MTRTIMIALMITAAAYHLYAAESGWKQKHEEAIALFRAGQYTDAQAMALAALDIARKEGNQVSIAKTFNTIGAIFARAGQDKPAEYHYRQAVSAGRECLAKDSTELARMIANLATVLDDMGMDKDAEALFKEALAIYETDPADSLEKARILANFARFYSYRDEFTRAERLLDRALEMTERASGDNLGDLVEIYYGMCALHERRGLQEKADKYLKLATAIKNNTAALAKAQADLAIAEESGDEGSMAMALNALALVLHDAMRFEASEAHYERAIELASKSFGENSLKVANMLSNKAGLYISMRRFLETIPLFEQAVAIYEKSANPDGSDDADMARLLYNLGNDYENHDELDKAAPVLARALAMAEKSLGNDSPDLVRILKSMSSLCRKTERGDLAKEYTARADAIAARQEQGASAE